ncbi:MAG: DUF1614 domain-containing protein [Firmicutes bacterium]|nr:DUF1614 domain-containing protein [Bacillota bacterium]
MNFGVVFLLVIAVIVYFGFAQRALDRLRLNDRTALLFLVAMIVGTYLPDIPLGGNASINLGGGVIPIILAVYLWSKCDRSEVSRSIAAVIITSAVVYAAMKIMPLEPTYNFFLDPLYIIALISGLVAYASGRTRRGSFIAGSMAIVINDLAALIENMFAGAASNITIGGAGVFDAVVISGFIALGLAELVGETVERVNLETGGEEKKGNDIHTGDAAENSNQEFKQKADEENQPAEEDNHTEG